MNNIDSDPIKIAGKTIFIIGFVILLIIALFGSFYTVDAGQRAVLLTWGKPADVSYESGLHFKIPLAQKAVKFDIKTQKYEAEASAASKDLQTVTAKIAINYHILPEQVIALYKEVGVDYAIRVMQPLEQEIVKATTSKFTAEELITKRELVREDIKSTLKERLAPRGIVVEEVSITNFDFSKSFNEAIEAKVTAEQQALAAKNKLEQIKFEAEQKVTSATAEATSLRIQSEALKESKDILQLRAIEKWDGKMPIVVGGATPFIDVSSYIGGNTQNENDQ